MSRAVVALCTALAFAYALGEPFVFGDDWTLTPAAEARSGGSLTLSTSGDPRTFNPLVSEESNIVVDAMNVAWHGAATLAWSPPGKTALLARAAESLTFSEDGLVVDIVLRDDMLWSDGSPITVADYVIRYRLESDPALGSSGLEGWYIGGEPITLEATGERRLRLTYPGPDRYALVHLHLPPLPDRIFGVAFRSGGMDAVRALWGVESDPRELLFSGAMRLASFTPGERIIFERNPYFGSWNVDADGRALPYLDGITYRIVDTDTALNLFLAGQLDEFTPRDLDDVGVIQGAVERGDLEAEIRESVFPTTSYTFLLFNWNLASNPFKEALFRDVEFRRAMAHLMDRDGIVELVFSGSGFPLYGSIHPTLTDWLHPNLAVPEFDPERALELLTGLGFTGRDDRGILVDGDGNRLSFRLTTNAGNTQREQIVAVYADIAREIGVEIVTDAVAFPLLVDQLLSEGEDRPFEAIVVGLTGGPSPWPFGENLYVCGATFHMWNRSGVCLDPLEARMEELARRGRAMLDDDDARAIGYEIQELMAELNELIYIAGPAAHHAASPSLQGYLAPHLVDAFNGLLLPVLMWSR